MAEPRDIPGMNPGPVNMPSSDPVLSSDTLNRYTQEQWRQMADSMRTYMLFTNDFTKRMREGLHQIEGLINDVHQVRKSAVDPTRPTPHDEAWPADPSAPRRAPVSEAPAPAAPETAPPAEDPKKPMTFAEGRAAGKTTSMGSVAQKVAAAGSRYMSQKGTLLDEEDGPGHTPRLSTLSTGGQGYKVFNAAGDVVREIPDGPGAADEAARAGSTARRVSLVAGSLGRFGAGEGVAGALGGTVARVAGPIGIGIGVADRVFDTMASQNAAGAQWRQVYGAEAGKYAISQRWDRYKAGWSGYFSGEGRDRALEGYDAMAQMGLSGDQLDNAVDFDKAMYDSHGMGASQSAAFVQLSRSTGATLSELADQIGRVGEAAVAAGQNSEAAIARFQSLAQGLATGVSNAPGASDAAADIVTTMAKSLPTSLNTESVQAGLLGGMSQQGMMLYAAQSGKDYTSVMIDAATRPESAVANIIGGGLRAAVDLVVQGSGYANAAALRAEIKRRWPDAVHLSSAQQRTILSEHPEMILAIQTILPQFGFSMNQGDIVQMFFEEVMGFSKGLKQTGPKKGGTAQVKGGFDSLAATSGDPAAALHDKIYGGGLKGFVFGSMNRGFDSYSDWASSTGDRDKAAESLLGTKASVKFSDFTGSTIEDATYNTSKGKKSWSEIWSDPDLVKEFDRGTMTVQGGGKNKNDAPRSVTDFTGYAGGGGKPQQAQKVEIAFTGVAEKLLRVTGPSDSQRAGVPASGTASWSDYLK